ncbi:MAG: UDP-N-acetylmuramoyl-tripeptide--D-alanyl-D-alanine ligase [Endomicrobiia bacterium]
MEFKLDVPIPLSEFLKYPKTISFIKNCSLYDSYNISKIALDTRSYKGKGGIFFALKGKFFDAHRFIPKIISKVDFVVISQKDCINNKYKNKFILVDDTTLALDYLAWLYRKSFKNLKMITVAGSNGKTTTKEIIKEIFSAKYNTVASKDNQNNLIGVAYTLFNLTKNTDFCITELGISLPNEMEILAKTTEPDYVVITNIAKEHLEFLTDIETVFKEETKILKYLNSKGFAILNKDDKFLKKIKNINIKWYSLKNKTAHVYAKDIKYKTTHTTFTAFIHSNNFFEELKLKTNLLGEHNIYNILAATTLAFFCGIDKQTIKKTIEKFKPVPMRGERFKINKNLIINESYNANPDSMKKTILEFQKIFCDKKRVLVLGDMLELGNNSPIEHKKLKDYIDFKNTKYIFLVGNEILHLYNTIKTKQNVFYYQTADDKFFKDFKEFLENNKNLTVLIKSSHGIGLWKIVEKIKPS